MFVKTALWATSGVSKRCNSAKIFLTFWKTGFCFVLLWYFLNLVGSLLKNLLPLKFVLEPLVHCNPFLLATFQDHFIFYQKNQDLNKFYLDEALGCMEFPFCNDMGDVRKSGVIDGYLQLLFSVYYLFVCLIIF